MLGGTGIQKYSHFFCRFACGTGVQGISVNCGDLYSRFLDCQWIDITDVGVGLYLLRLIVNPDNLVVESDHRNNELTCVIELKPNFGMQTYSCKLSGRKLLQEWHPHNFSIPAIVLCNSLKFFCQHPLHVF